MREIKFLNLKAQYPLIKQEILTKFDDIIENTAFVSGKYIKEFEKKFADYIGVKHSVAVNNGTSALFLTLLANNITSGDEVIIPVNTFIATAEAITLAGAKPVFVDILAETYNINPEKIEEKITFKTKAIIPVHLYGQCADIDPILKIAKKHNLTVIEDACQAHGAEYKNKKAGAIGQCGAFSFYPGKNLGAWGEAGAIATDNDELAYKIRLLRYHGSPRKYEHEIIGGNFRASEFQGAVLSAKIKHLEEWNKKRRRNAELYLELLAKQKNIIPPYCEGYNKHVWHLFVIRAQARDKLIENLKKNNVQTGIHYPFPLHLSPAYKHLNYKANDFPVAEKIAKEIISLPMYPELKKEDIIKAAKLIKLYGANKL